MLAENIYSSDIRLLKHLEILQKWQSKPQFLPITLHIAPTDKCNLNCEFCSVKKREGNELSLEEIKWAVKYMCEIIGTLKSVEITGGGEPTLYPQINDLLRYLYRYNLSVGLITNGLELAKIRLDLFERLSWVRISLNGIDYNKSIDIPFLMKLDYFNKIIGFSYVINSKTEDRTYQILSDFVDFPHLSYLRLVPDCNVGHIIDTSKIPELLLKNPKVILQQKDSYVPKKCYIGAFKPFLNSDGYLYSCSTNPLFERKFGEKFRMVHCQDINKKEIKFPDTKDCKLCFYNKQNELLSNLIQPVITPDFI